MVRTALSPLDGRACFPRRPTATIVIQGLLVRSSKKSGVPTPPGGRDRRLGASHAPARSPLGPLVRCCTAWIWAPDRRGRHLGLPDEDRHEQRRPHAPGQPRSTTPRCSHALVRPARPWAKKALLELALRRERGRVMRIRSRLRMSRAASRALSQQTATSVSLRAAQASAHSLRASMVGDFGDLGASSCSAQQPQANPRHVLCPSPSRLKCAGTLVAPAPPSPACSATSSSSTCPSSAARGPAPAAEALDEPEDVELVVDEVLDELDTV